jgi:hypothetical protein
MSIPAVVILLGALGLAVGASASGLSLGGGTTAASLAGLSTSDRWAQIQTLIRSRNLNGMDPRAAILMADMENGLSIGEFTAIFQATNSLYNRHVGGGVVGVPNSDGIWTGSAYYASPADPDLRIYASLEDSVDDFVKLMSDGLYRQALQAAQAGDLGGYIKAVADVGYSASPNYQAELSSRAAHLGYA